MDSNLSDIVGKPCVAKMASLYSENSEYFKTIRKQLLQAFCEKDTGFEQKEYVRYRDGVAAWELFMEKCLEEYEKSLGGDKKLSS